MREVTNSKSNLSKRKPMKKKLDDDFVYDMGEHETEDLEPRRSARERKPTPRVKGLTNFTM